MSVEVRGQPGGWWLVVGGWPGTVQSAITDVGESTKVGVSVLQLMIVDKVKGESSFDCALVFLLPLGVHYILLSCHFLSITSS